VFFDAVVIGSGPAGCAAAISCLQRGLHTLILTKASQQPDARMQKKRPSESIHPGVASLLEPLHAADAIATAARARYEGIQVGGQLNPFSPDESTDIWEGYHIDRDVFDHTLLSCAIRQGVAVRDEDQVSRLLVSGGQVTGLTTTWGARIKSRYIIDASGYKRIAGRLLQFREEICSPVLVAWTGISVLPEGGEGSNIVRDGYARFIPEAAGWSWIAADGEDQYSWTRLARKGSRQFPPPAMLEHALPGSPVVVSNRQWSVFRPLCSEGVLLCGDAAGMLDPAAGQGVLNALHSGMKAAETVFLNLTHPAMEALTLMHYDQWFLQQFYAKVDALKAQYGRLGIGILG
jgi:flavin-dependent dehydrogenase